MSEPSKYGKLYWCVKSGLSEDGEIYVYADQIDMSEDGGLVMLGREGQVNMAFAAGQWTAVFAASALDGSAVAVEHWKGEVSR